MYVSRFYDDVDDDILFRSLYNHKKPLSDLRHLGNTDKTKKEIAE